MLLRFAFFMKPPIRSFRILVMENLPFFGKLLLFTELQQALINKQVPESLAAKKLMYIRPRIVRGKIYFFSFGFCWLSFAFSGG